MTDFDLQEYWGIFDVNFLDSGKHWWAPQVLGTKGEWGRRQARGQGDGAPSSPMTGTHLQSFSSQSCSVALEPQRDPGMTQAQPGWAVTVRR